MRCLILALALGTSLFGQADVVAFALVHDGGLGSNGSHSGFAEFRAPADSRVVTGAPFSATQVLSSLQVLGSNLIARPAGPSPEPWAVYRDAMGRTRLEFSAFPNSPRLVQIDHPAERVFYILEPGKRIAHRMSYGEPRGDPASPAVNPPSEMLGNRTIQGLEAEGLRTVAPGSVEDVWRSPALQITLLRVTRTPGGYERTLAVENLSLEEPDAPLFEVPPGYEVLNEVESFRIGWR